MLAYSSTFIWILVFSCIKLINFNQTLIVNCRNYRIYAYQQHLFILAVFTKKSIFKCFHIKNIGLHNIITLTTVRLLQVDITYMIQVLCLNSEMKVDSEEVKRHLDILGYTDIEPSLFDAFVRGKYLFKINSCRT